MILRCIGRCTNVNKKSQSPAFMGLVVGDIIEFSTEIRSAGRNYTTYATYIKCFNPKTNGTSELSFNQIGRVLNNFEFEQV
jgi:hypothetical protein